MAVGVGVFYFTPGNAGPPAAAGMSVEQLGDLVNQQSDMDPVTANAVASAKQRAYEKQVASDRLLAEKAKRDAKAAAALKARLQARRDAAKKAAALAKANPTTAQNKALGKQMNALKGWSGCWPSLLTMWTHESQWNERADNPGSNAYGIPQALPGSKMASAGPRWQTNSATQISWGLSYIKARYHDPCGAWSFWQAHHWY
ncbi:MAG: hypothetical protein QOE54_3904 [Streptosporangiaceae bacterium]|jgi:hypothetical protein|nr:hypothetical protein [Streptosporangiaceae bacterium]MDX6431538.1 hypothetical protein [Streptosporangiaceae bacterium]